MEIRVSAHEPGMSPSVYESNPDDKEISDDDDDDRNHKHRRREDNTRSHSLDDDVTFTKSYRRGSKPSQNGHLYGQPGSQSNETWKKYSFNPLEKDISARFDQKRPGFTHFPRGSADLNQKFRVNQQFPVDPGAVRGRGRESSLWSHQRDPRFNSNDIASQIVQQGSVVPHSLFAGRGSNSRGPSWSSFGLVPGLPNGGPDMHMLHPLGLQGTYRSTISPSLNMGLARQRCRDFEEQGFCLRGDMCPMEHGVNRIVVEDVQSLSQFNLPVSLASANLSIPPSVTGPSLATSVTTNTLSNSKDLHGKNIKRDNGLDISKTLIDSASADFYDPDQPLWGNDSHTTPAISQPNLTKNDSLLDPSPSGDQHDDFDNEPFGAGMGPTRSSVHDRITPAKKASNEIPEAPVVLNCGQDPPFHRNPPGGNGCMVRKHSQKAQRTLFVSGIPHQNNKRESLISHFKRFGEVINIYIPLNSERAFVQFSKREEAEAALMAPDAVMGNRFIKLWWANRDNIPPHGSTVSSVSQYKGKDEPLSTSQNDMTTPPPVVTNVTKTPPPLQKKLEVLKEELRKKQELLDQKRNDFRRKLDKLQKQATGVKGEVESEQVAKKQKVGVLGDSEKAATPCSSDRDISVPSKPDEVAVNSRKSVTPNSKTTPVLTLQESPRLKSLAVPWGLVESLPVVTNLANRFKLDNRPTAFKIIPPLPEGLADVSVLKEHFSTYGDVSKVELNGTEPIEIYFTTRHAAEKAFLSGKNWKGHKLQFVWLNTNKTPPATASKPNSDDSSTKPVVEVSKSLSQKPSTSGDEKKQGKKPEESNRSNSSDA